MRIRARWLALGAAFFVVGACSNYELADGSGPDDGGPAEAGVASDGPAVDGSSTDSSIDDAGGDGGRNDGGIVGTDASPPCPYAGGCPCSGCSITTVGTYPYEEPYAAVFDATNLYFTSVQKGLIRLPFAGGAAQVLYETPANGSGAIIGEVTRVFLAPNRLVFVEEPDNSATVIRSIALPLVSNPTVETLVQQPGQDMQPDNQGVGASSDRVYWFDSDRRVRSTTFDGGSPLQLATPLAENLVVGGGIPFIVNDNGDIDRVTPNLGAVTPYPLADYENALTTNGTSIAWATHSRFGMMLASVAPDGGAVFQRTDEHVDVIVFGDDGFVYFDTGSTTYRCRLPDCAGGAALLITDPAIPDFTQLVAVVGGNAYFTSVSGNPFTLIRIALHD